MGEPFIAEIVMFGGNFAPRSWAYCNGQLLAISSNTALFSLLGTTYGGDGRTTFALPDLRGRTAVHSGGNSAGPGLTPRPLGSRGGAQTVTLNTNQMPTHNHTVGAHNETADETSPGGNVLGADQAIFSGEDNDTTMRSNMIGNAGGNQAHENMMPFLAVNYIIALFGTFPSRN